MSESWSLVNSTILNSFAEQEINREAYDGIGVLSLLEETQRAAFVEHEDLFCEDRLLESHEAFHGNDEYLRRGKAGPETGLTAFAEDGSLISGDIQADYAIMTYHYPPQSTCESQKVNFKSSPRLTSTINATLALETPLMSAFVERNVVISGYFPSQFSERRTSRVNYPQSYMVAPVFRNDGSTEESAVVVADVGFDVPLWGIFPKNLGGFIDVVYDNTCEQSFTYRVNKDEVALVAAGNGRESMSDKNVAPVSVSLAAEDLQNSGSDDRHCRYRMVSLRATEAQQFCQVLRH